MRLDEVKERDHAEVVGNPCGRQNSSDCGGAGGSPARDFFGLGRGERWEEGEMREEAVGIK